MKKKTKLIINSIIIGLPLMILLGIIEPIMCGKPWKVLHGLYLGIKNTIVAIWEEL